MISVRNTQLCTVKQTAGFSVLFLMFALATLLTRPGKISSNQVMKTRKCCNVSTQCLKRLCTLIGQFLSGLRTILFLLLYEHKLMPLWLAGWSAKIHNCFTPASTKCGCSSGDRHWTPKKEERRRKCNDLKCVRKPTKSRLSLTHHANKSSRWAE